MAYMLLLGSFDSLFFWRAFVDEPNGDELDGRGQEYYYITNKYSRTFFLLSLYCHRAPSRWWWTSTAVEREAQTSDVSFSFSPLAGVAAAAAGQHTRLSFYF